VGAERATTERQQAQVLRNRVERAFSRLDSNFAASPPPMIIASRPTKKGRTYGNEIMISSCPIDSTCFNFKSKNDTLGSSHLIIPRSIVHLLLIVFVIQSCATTHIIFIIRPSTCHAAIQPSMDAAMFESLPNSRPRRCFSSPCWVPQASARAGTLSDRCWTVVL